LVTKHVSKWESKKNYPDIENLVRISEIYKLKIDDLLDESIDVERMNEKGVFLINHESKENLKTYINWLPFIGLISSLISFVIFFVIVGVDEVWRAALYCLMPFIVFTLLYIPLKMVMRKNRNHS